MYFWSSGVNSQLIGKAPDAGKDWGQKEKTVSEDEMTGWHHWCDGDELGQTLGEGEGQGGLACCNPWCQRVGHNWVTEQQQCPLQHYLQLTRYGNNPSAHQQRNGWRGYVYTHIYIHTYSGTLHTHTHIHTYNGNITQPWKKMKSCHLQQHEWT